MSKGFLLGLLIGLLAGGLAGILIAPAPGAGTRRRISDATLPTRERVGDLVGTLRSRSVETVEHIRQAI